MRGPIYFHIRFTMTNNSCAALESGLTLLVGGEEDAEAALAARLVRPHPDDAQRGDQHDVVGHRGAELALQVLHRAASGTGGQT